MSGSQTGKVAIVTDGSANTGGLFAGSLASDGARVVVHCNRPRRKEEAEQAAAELEKHGVQGMPYQADLTSVQHVTALVDATVERFGFGAGNLLTELSGQALLAPDIDLAPILSDVAELPPMQP